MSVIFEVMQSEIQVLSCFGGVRHILFLIGSFLITMSDQCEGFPSDIPFASGSQFHLSLRSLISLVHLVDLVLVFVNKLYTLLRSD